MENKLFDIIEQITLITQYLFISPAFIVLLNAYRNNVPEVKIKKAITIQKLGNESTLITSRVLKISKK
jgi:hypothetical protein